MHPDVAHELNDADERIVDRLREGRNLPQNLAEDLGYSRQYVQNRLQMLKAADYVENLGGGLYELVDDPREEDGTAMHQPGDAEPVASTADAVDVDALRAERDTLQEQLDAAQARIDDLEGQPDHADVDLDRARECLARALDQLPEDVPGRMAAADARALLEVGDDV